MATFKFVGQQKETVWVHYPITVEASTYEEASIKLRVAVQQCDGLYFIWNEDNDINSDWHSADYEPTGERILPSEDNGRATIVIFDAQGKNEVGITNIAPDTSRDAYNKWLDSKYDEVTIMHWTVPASYAFQNLEPNEYEQSYEEWVYWQNNPSEYLERTGEDINNPNIKEVKYISNEIFVQEFSSNLNNSQRAEA